MCYSDLMIILGGIMKTVKAYCSFGLILDKHRGLLGCIYNVA